MNALYHFRTLGTDSLLFRSIAQRTPLLIRFCFHVLWYAAGFLCRSILLPEIERAHGILCSYRHSHSQKPLLGVMATSESAEGSPYSHACPLYRTTLVGVHVE